MCGTIIQTTEPCIYTFVLTVQKRKKTTWLKGAAVAPSAGPALENHHLIPLRKSQTAFLLMLTTDQPSFIITNHQSVPFDENLPKPKNIIVQYVMYCFNEHAVLFCSYYKL